MNQKMKSSRVVLSVVVVMSVDVVYMGDGE